jgi:hypothetical protein
MNVADYAILAVCIGGMVAMYFAGRIDGMERARTEIAQLARQKIARHHPQPIPDVPVTDLDVMAQTLDVLATELEKHQRTEKR